MDDVRTSDIKKINNENVIENGYDEEEKPIRTLLNGSHSQYCVFDQSEDVSCSRRLDDKSIDLYGLNMR